MKDPQQELDRKRAAQEECQRRDDMGQHPLIFALPGPRLRLGRHPRLLPANRRLEAIDKPGLHDELAGLQRVDVILPVAPAADDADKGVAAVEQIVAPTGRGSTMMLYMSARCGPVCILYIGSLRRGRAIWKPRSGG